MHLEGACEDVFIMTMMLPQGGSQLHTIISHYDFAMMPARISLLFSYDIPKDAVDDIPHVGIGATMVVVVTVDGSRSSRSDACVPEKVSETVNRFGGFKHLSTRKVNRSQDCGTYVCSCACKTHVRGCE